MNRKVDILLKVLSLVVIIFLLALIAISFLQSRKVSSMTACIANMKQLEGAREQALLAGNNAFQWNIPFGSSVYTNLMPTQPNTNTVHAVPSSPAGLRDCPGEPIIGDTMFEQH